jgi:hypothetical protein
MASVGGKRSRIALALEWILHITGLRSVTTPECSLATSFPSEVGASPACASG